MFSIAKATVVKYNPDKHGIWEIYQNDENTFNIRKHKENTEINLQYDLINTVDQLVENIEKIEYYLTEGSEPERKEAFNLIKRGTCFVAYKIGTELRFAPSRFLGYKNNDIIKHSENEYKDGRITNKAIVKILKSIQVVDDNYDKKYNNYCLALGIKPQKNGAYGVKRKFWNLKLEFDFKMNIELTGDFPEGRIVERTHRARERNSKVIEIAKQNFKTKFGRLFCQVCKFDFSKIYGSIGEDFIEAHHTIAVKDMLPEHKTKPEEIAMLCSNCHRMIHRKRPWLNMDKLGQILNNKK